MRNKFLTKILGTTLGLAMAIGVGVGVAANNRVAKGLDADSNTFAFSSTYQGKAGTGSDKTFTWSNAILTVTQKGNGATQPNDSYTTAPRWYGTANDQNLCTFTPADGVTITQMVFTVSQGSFSAGTWSDGDINSNTWTGSQSSAFSFLPTAQVRPTSIAITYSTGGSEAVVTSITASIKDGDYYAGDTLSPSDFNVTANWSEGDPTYPTNGFTWTVNGVEDGVLALGNNTVVVTYQGSSATIENFQATRDPRWATTFANTAVASIEVKPDEDTDEKYYVTAKITAITSTKYGNGNAVDEDGTEFAIYGMYNFNGSVDYENMIEDHKPVVGDIAVLYGVFTEFNSKPEIKSAWVVQRNGSVLKELASTLDLSTDTTSSKSTSMVTWGNPESDAIGMALSKGTSGTNANNYIGGNGTYTSTRFYKDQTLAIVYNPAAIKMVKIVFAATTAGYASALANSVIDNATAVADDKTVTLTVTKGTQTVTVHVGATCGFTEAQFIYEEASAQQKIECGIKTSSSLSYNYVKNGENDFTISNVKVRFGGKVSKALWDGLTGVEGFGVMVSTADTDPTGYIGEDNFKDEYAVALDVAEGNIDAAINLLCNNTKIFNFSKSGTPNLHEAATDDRYTEDTYAWTLAQKINVDHLTRTYVAIAYIRTSTGLVFLQEERISVQEIAERMVATGEYNEDPMFESLSYLANL